MYILKICFFSRMASYWDEHDTNDSEVVGDTLDFIRRLNLGQLPEHWHLSDFVDYSIPFHHVRAMFADNPDFKKV
jgi:hypothetical protein